MGTAEVAFAKRQVKVKNAKTTIKGPVGWKADAVTLKVSTMPFFQAHFANYQRTTALQKTCFGSQFDTFERFSGFVFYFCATTLKNGGLQPQGNSLLCGF